MRFEVEILSGPDFIKEALYGIGLSYGLTSDIPFREWKIDDKSLKVATKLAHMQGGHNKFLESIMFTLLIRAPRYWWQEFDTYRVGVTKQSESTIHTITKRFLTQNDFVEDIDNLDDINKYIKRYQDIINVKKDEKEEEKLFREIKNILPEGFLQRRIVVLNAKSLQNMYMQRKNHRLKEWHKFLNDISNDLTDACEDDVNEWIFGEVNK